MNTVRHATSSRTAAALCCGGFTLIEALIALVVLSIGLLGLANLQALGLRQNNTAYQRSQATLQAYDMADRMRANLTAVRDGDYDNPTGSAHAECSSAAGCTTTQMAEQDFYEWNLANAHLLRSGTGVVCIDSTPADGTPDDPACDDSGQTYAIKVWSDEDRDGVADAPFVWSFQP